jgi:hypothetical protein
VDDLEPLEQQGFRGVSVALDLDEDAHMRGYARQGVQPAELNKGHQAAEEEESLVDEDV